MFISFLFLLGIVLGTNGACFCDFQNSTQDCNYNGTTIKDGGRLVLRDKCLECSCVQGTMTCCLTGARVHLLPTTCKIIRVGKCNEVPVLISDERMACVGAVMFKDKNKRGK